MKKIIISLIILFSIQPIPAMALTGTLYMRSDTHTINTITGYNLSDINSNSAVSFNTSPSIKVGTSGDLTPISGTANYNAVSISILHSDGTNTSIGNSAANTVRSGIISSEGLQDATFSCPETNLNKTDALQVVLYTNATTNGAVTENMTRTFVSGQLGWSKLEASTWTLYRYSIYNYANMHICIPPGTCALINVLYSMCFSNITHGSSSYATGITGIDYSLTGGSYSFILD